MAARGIVGGAAGWGALRRRPGGSAGAGPPANVVVVADPDTIASDGSSTLTATVTDADGNPCPGLTVEWFEAGGSSFVAIDPTTTTTDGAGQAVTTLTALGVDTLAEPVAYIASPEVFGSTFVTVLPPPALGSPSDAAIVTTYGADLSADGLSWASARGAQATDGTSLLLYAQRYNGGSQRNAFLVSGDGGATWADVEGASGGEGFLARGTPVYDAANDCIHLLCVGFDPGDGAIYRRYTITRTAGVVTGLTRVTSIQLCSGGAAYEMPIILQPTAGRLVAAWTVRTGSAGQLLACTVDISGGVAAASTASNWTHLGVSGAAAAGLTLGAASVTVVGSVAADAAIYYAVRALASGDLAWVYHSGTVPGTWSHRRSVKSGATWPSLSTPATITNVARAGTDAGYSLKNQLVSQLTEDGAGRLFVGLATWKSNADGDTWGVWRVNADDSVTALLDAYSAGGAHSYAPTGDVAYDATADRLVVTWIVSGSGAEYAQVRLYDTDGAAAGAAVQLDGAHPADIPLILNTRQGGAVLFAFRQKGSPPQPGYAGTVPWA